MAMYFMIVDGYLVARCNFIRSNRRLLLHWRNFAVSIIVLYFVLWWMSGRPDLINTSLIGEVGNAQIFVPPICGKGLERMRGVY